MSSTAYKLRPIKFSPVRFVYEHGVTVQRSTDGAWYFESVEKGSSFPPVNPGDISREYGRPILTTYRASADDEMTSLLSQTKENLPLDWQLSKLAEGDWENEAIWYDVFNLIYIVGAVIYHCKQLADIYSNICKDYVKRYVNVDLAGSRDEDEAMFGPQPTGYYEFDALITAAKRTYNTTRYILWKVFGPYDVSVPASFEKTLIKCNRLPSALAERLNMSWSRFGKKLTDYRDCIQHYISIDFWSSTVLMKRLQGGVWSTSLWIPDNPEAKSKGKFKFEERIDSLTYGWNVTSEMLDIVSAIKKEVQNRGSGPE